MTYILERNEQLYHTGENNNNPLRRTQIDVPEALRAELPQRGVRLVIHNVGMPETPAHVSIYLIGRSIRFQCNEYVETVAIHSTEHTERGRTVNAREAVDTVTPELTKILQDHVQRQNKKVESNRSE